ncbi:MAG TPA: hypothetical protein VGD17_04385, partial [Chitinophagaceae bacterium]
MVNNITDIDNKLELFRKTVSEIGKDKAVLKLSKHFPREEVAFLMDQLNGQAVALQKFPFITDMKGIVYQPSYYLEQTSSEKTARFKAELVNGKLLADMTGGFGIDTYFFSEKIPDT